MRYQALILCMLFLLASCKPDETVMRKWPGGQKQVTYKIYRGDTTHLADVFYTAYYPNGKVWKSGYIKNGEAVGEWCYFYQSGKLQSKGTKIHGRNEGPYTVYYESGEEEQKGMYVNGEMMAAEQQLFNRDGSKKYEWQEVNFSISEHPEKWTAAQVEEIRIDFYTMAAMAESPHPKEYSDCMIEQLQKYCNYKDIQPLSQLERWKLVTQLVAKEKAKNCQILL